MKLNPSIIASKDFKLIKVFRLKLARYSTANKVPSINASGQNTQYVHNVAPNSGFWDLSTTYMQITIVNNDSSNVNKFEASLNNEVVIYAIYDRHMFMVEATSNPSI